MLICAFIIFVYHNNSTIPTTNIIYNNSQTYMGILVALSSHTSIFRYANTYM